MSSHPFRFILLVFIFLGLATGIYLLVPRTVSEPVLLDPTLSTNYVKTVEWPPQMQQLDKPFTCIEAGSEIQSAGKTESRIINGRMYCVTTLTEGAAGTIYTQYVYAFAREEKTVILNFSLKRPQCANYDEPEKSACENEQNTFDVDNMVDAMVQSLR